MHPKVRLMERLVERLDRKELMRPATLIASEEEATSVPEISGIVMSDRDLAECASESVDEILDEIDQLNGLSGRTLEERVDFVL